MFLKSILEILKERDVCVTLPQQNNLFVNYLNDKLIFWNKMTHLLYKPLVSGSLLDFFSC